MKLQKIELKVQYKNNINIKSMFYSKFKINQCQRKRGDCIKWQLATYLKKISLNT